MIKSEPFFELGRNCLYADFDAFYASIEQTDFPECSGRPVAVVQVLHEKATVISLSEEAREAGLKSGIKTGDAMRRIPDLTVKLARHDRYRDVNQAYLEIARGIFGKLREYSIDEFASDLPEGASARDCLELAYRFKTALGDRFGEILSCSIGVAANDFLAKLAATMGKPDGFMILDETRITDILSLKLRDFPGIGPVIEGKLREYGIKNVEGLVDSSPGELRRAWGSIRGEQFYYVLRGSREYDFRGGAEPKRQISSSQIIPSYSRNVEVARKTCVKLLVNSLRKARGLGYRAGEVEVAVIYRNPRNPRIDWRFRRTVALPGVAGGSALETDWVTPVRNLLEHLPERADVTPQSAVVTLKSLKIETEPKIAVIDVVREKFRDKIDYGSVFEPKGEEPPEEPAGEPEPARERVSPETAKKLPRRIIHWIATKYGWPDADFFDKLLPIQTSALNIGACDPDGVLNQSGIVAAPTSAGKTLIAELRMFSRWIEDRETRKKTVMLVPTREIGRERWNSFRIGYSSVTDKRTRKAFKIVYSDGDVNQFDRDIWDSKFDLAIMVNEKFRFFVQNPKFLLDIGEIVFDEIGFLSDTTRGAFLESAILSVLSHPEPPLILGLTHPAEDPGGLLEQLSLNGTREVFFLESDTRPIPIEIGLWTPDDSVAEFTNSNTGKTRAEEIFLDYPSSILATLRELVTRFLGGDSGEYAKNLVLALPTKRQVINTARMLSALCDTEPEIRELIARNKSTALVANRMKGLDPSRIQMLLNRILPLGLGIHSADLSLTERRLVSEAFRNAEIPILICTSTMAHGINLPAQSIVFLNWGQKRRSFQPDSAGEPFYHLLEKDFIPWLGRVGRVGQPTAGSAEALYVAAEGKGSEEYRFVDGLIRNQRVKLRSSIYASEDFAGLVLFGVNTLFHRSGKAVGESAVFDFFEAKDGEKRERIANALNSMAVLVDKFPEMTPKSKSGGNGSSDATAETEVSEKSPEPVELDALQFTEKRDGEREYLITLLGRIAAAHGVHPETCRFFRKFLLGRDANEPVDLLEILSLVTKTHDGRKIYPISISRDSSKRVNELFLAEYDSLETEVEPPVSVHMRGTLLAIRDWSVGLDQHWIETTYGLAEANANLHEKSRDFARLVRVFAMIAQTQPGREQVRPQNAPDMGVSYILPEHDLDLVADQVMLGVPPEAGPIGRLGIETLSRAWIMRLKGAVEKTGTDADLPLLERLRITATENEQMLFDVLPTGGLAMKVSQELKNTSRRPLGDVLRQSPGIVRDFYSNDLVVRANLLQGKNRWTALKVITKAGFSVFRRNEASGGPIEIKDAGDFGYWVDRNAVEFLSEIGKPDGDNYVVDRFLIDIDPRDDYPLEKLKDLAFYVINRLKRHSWTADCYIHWTGGSGFHVVGEFPNGIFRDIEVVARELESFAATCCDEVAIFLKPLTAIYQPHAVLDLSPVMRRGVYRNAFSFNASTSGVAVPVGVDSLFEFDPETHAGKEFVLGILKDIEADFDTYLDLATAYNEAFGLRARK